MVRPVNMRQVEAFKAIMEAGTVSRAADLLRISQPAASKLLAHLEADTGLRLFDRSLGRLNPTEAGRHLYTEIDRIFTGLHQVERAIDSIRREAGQRLLVGLMPAMAGGFIRRVVSAFLAERPGVHISMITRSSALIMDQVSTRRLDLGLISARSEDPLLSNEAILTYPLVCILPPAHRLARREVISVTDLADEPFIGFADTSQTQLRVADAFQQAGLLPHTVLDASTASVVGEFVAAGIGVSVMHPMLAEPVRSRVVARPFLPQQRFEFLICRNEASKHAPLVEAFTRHLRAEAERFLAEIETGEGWALPV